MEHLKGMLFTSGGSRIKPHLPLQIIIYLAGTPSPLKIAIQLAMNYLMRTLLHGLVQREVEVCMSCVCVCVCVCDIIEYDIIYWKRKTVCSSSLTYVLTLVSTPTVMIHPNMQHLKPSVECCCCLPILYWRCGAVAAHPYLYNKLPEANISDSVNAFLFI